MAETRDYELRLFDRTLVTFSISDGPFGQEVTSVSADETSAHLMPCGLELTPEGIWNWLEMRSIPVNRKNADKVCREFGFALGEVEALYSVSLGLSLNDSYWIVPKGFDGMFSEYNLFENAFSEAIGALAISGEHRGKRLSGNTPELTTDGTLRKGWRILNGKRILYKGASDGSIPGEPLSEYLASVVARDLGLNAVEYGLDAWESEVCSTCENFATRQVSYVPFAVASGITDLAGSLWWFAHLGDEQLEAYIDMLTLDALLCNTDRHLTNFGVLRDNGTGLPLGLAPIFDNGRSLFPQVAEDSHAQFLLEAELRGPAFGGRSFEELLSRIMGPRQQDLLMRAAQRGVVGNVLAPPRRVAELDAFMRQRARSLLEIPAVDHERLIEKLNDVMARRSPKTDGPFRLNV